MGHHTASWCEGVLEGTYSLPCPHGHFWCLAVCIMCTWAWGVALLAGIDAVGESFALARTISLLLFSFPALLCFRLELTQRSCKAAITKPKSGKAVGWASGGTLSSHAAGMSKQHCVWLLGPGEQLGQIAPFIPLHCHIGGKIRSDSYCSFPSLLTRAWQGDGACCYSQACHLLTQQLWWENSVGGMLDPASLTFH